MRKKNYNQPSIKLYKVSTTSLLDNGSGGNIPIGGNGGSVDGAKQNNWED